MMRLLLIASSIGDFYENPSDNTPGDIDSDRKLLRNIKNRKSQLGC